MCKGLNLSYFVERQNQPLEYALILFDRISIADLYFALTACHFYSEKGKPC